MKLFWIKRFSAAIKAVLLCIASSTAFAQNIPLHAEGLSEELVAINIDNGRQIGVLSKRKGALSPSQLIVLLPGYPSVIRPEMANDMMVSSQLTGNFLIRARRHLASDQTMTLLVDCHTSVGSICTSGYQSSRDRYRHVKTLIETAREKAPSIKQVYLVSTSAGSISSAFIDKYGQSDFAGVIHTASIDPTAPRSYTELENFDYSAIKIPQAFIHHIDDPCGLTGYNYIRSVADRYRVPLITVSGGDGFTGDACNAHTQHGFKGKEAAVMQRILQLVRGGNWRPSRI